MADPTATLSGEGPDDHTTRLPDLPTYDMSLTCVAGRSAETGEWIRVTFTGTIPKGGIAPLISLS